MASSSSRHDSRALAASSSMLSLSSTEWDGDETGLNTGFFETSDSELEIFRTSGSDTDASEQRKEPKKKILKKTSRKKETSSSSESDSSSDEDTKKKTSTPMKKYSISQTKVKQGLQNFLRHFSMQEVTMKPSTKDPTSSGNEKPAAKKMKIEETVKTEFKSSSESSQSEDDIEVIKQDERKAELRQQKKMIKQHLKLQNEEMKEIKKENASLRDENLIKEHVEMRQSYNMTHKIFEVQATRIKNIRKEMLQRKHKLKLLAENNDHLQDRLRRRDETIKGLNEKNLQLTEKLKKISKTQDAFMCIICFDSFHDKEVKPASLKCGHTYCMRCLTGSNGLFSGKLVAKCPNCRDVSSKNNIRQIYFS